MALAIKKFSTYHEYWDGNDKFACLQWAKVAGKEYWTVTLTPFNKNKQQVFGTQKDAEGAVYLLHSKGGKQ